HARAHQRRADVRAPRAAEPGPPRRPPIDAALLRPVARRPVHLRRASAARRGVRRRGDSRCAELGGHIGRLAAGLLRSLPAGPSPRPPFLGASFLLRHSLLSSSFVVLRFVLTPPLPPPRYTRTQEVPWAAPRESCPETHSAGPSIPVCAAAATLPMRASAGWG